MLYDEIAGITKSQEQVEIPIQLDGRDVPVRSNRRRSHYPLCQFNRIVLEAPSLSSRLTFGSTFTIWLSKPLYRSVIGRTIGRKPTEAYTFFRATASEVVFYKPLEIEVFVDSYAVLYQLMTSLKGANNNAPKHPRLTPEPIRDEVILMRPENPKWGKRRIADELKNANDGWPWIAPTP